MEAQLGRPLDKAQQCSAWAHRPLAPEQISYAAGDAACLLALLGDMAGRASPEEYPLGPAAVDGEGLTAGAGSSQQQGGGGQQGPGGSGGRDAGGAAPVPSADAGANADGGSSGGGSPWMACGAERLQAAAEWWGSRLEISGGRAVKQRLPRLSKSKLRTERQEELEGGWGGAWVRWVGWPACNTYPVERRAPMLACCSGLPAGMRASRQHATCTARQPCHPPMHSSSLTRGAAPPATHEPLPAAAAVPAAECRRGVPHPCALDGPRPAAHRRAALHM